MNTPNLSLLVLVGAVAMSPGLFAEDPPTYRAGNNPSTSSSLHRANMEGKIVTLRQYLTGASGWASAASTSDQVTGNPSGNQDSRATSDRSTAADRKDSGTASSAPDSVWSARMTTMDEPLVFVAKSTMRGSTTSNPVGSPPGVAGEPKSSGALTNASSNYGGEAYVILCNPNDVGSRNALSRAKALHSQHGSVASTSGQNPDSDRLRVKGTDASASTTKEKEREKEKGNEAYRRDSGVNSRTDSTRSDPESYASSMEGKAVVISGKVLSRGGLQAIEITSLQAVDGSTLTLPSTPVNPTDK